MARDPDLGRTAGVKKVYMRDHDAIVDNKEACNERSVTSWSVLGETYRELSQRNHLQVGLDKRTVHQWL